MVSIRVRLRMIISLSFSIMQYKSTLLLEDLSLEKISTCTNVQDDARRVFSADTFEQPTFAVRAE
jgi:hypothetical protein